LHDLAGKFYSDRAPEAISDAELNDPRASPILAPDSVIKNLPPAYITTAEADPLHDGVVDYATRLMDNGVEVVLKV
jgi:acetyl esterase/lipase